MFALKSSFMFSSVKPYLAQVEQYIERFLSQKDERIYGDILPYIKRGGKRIRPSLCLLCCKLSGGDMEEAVRHGALIELFHNFTLIHDDIEDNSDFRRGAPALHKSHGVAYALNAGDALYTCIWEEVGKSDFFSDYAQCFRRVVEGQGIEIDWIRKERFDISEEEYFEMIRGKTCALLSLSCYLGGALGGKFAEELRRYGEYVGAAFQIRDDVLNLIGDFEKYKKEIGGDISEGKRTLMVLYAFKHSDKAARLEEILRMHTKEEALIKEAISIIEGCGAISYCQKIAEEYAEKAKEALANLPPSKEKEELLALADYSAHRDK